MRAHTHQLDPLFRFKVDFVRKRALPLVKGGAHVPLDPADVAVVGRLAQPLGAPRPRAGDRDRRLRAARSRGRGLREAGTDAEKADGGGATSTR